MLPFLLSAAALLAAVVPVIRLPDLRPDSQRTPGLSGVLAVAQVYRAALPALVLPFVFGFMESALNANLPLSAGTRGVGAGGGVSGAVPVCGGQSGLSGATRILE